MTKVHGKDTVYLLDGNDLSTHSNSVEFERSADSHDVTTFGNNSHRKFGGLGDGSVTLAGFYDTVATSPRRVIEPLIGTIVPLVHRPEGTGTGKPEDQVSVLVQSYTESSPVADMVTWTADLEMDGDVTTIDQV